ncbi:MAG TPA: glutamate formimidoyltransferase [Bryobacteraceae bacterium]|jgi:glutamate formiminotransferase|nr:glutamate formimidoyltransferase [Bryobacteraceae bacterium]
MPQTIVECVPNFSEGRDAAKVDAIVEAIRSVRGIAILDREMDADHNRSVVTFAGPATAVVEAAFRGAERAIGLIDLRSHTGVHPRIGAVDVVPFIPVEGVTLEDCVRLANELGMRLWESLQVPVYLYEAAARRPDRINLENIRRGQFEGLRDEVRTNPGRLPDIGPNFEQAELHPTAGATVVGARKFLIAYNINLNTADVEIAKRIAKAIRFSSGGFRYVKSMGVPLASRNLAQVSMNLTDFEQTPIHRVFETVRAEAARYGASIVGSEIVGLIPKRALELTAEWYLQVENFHPSLVLENRLAEAAHLALEEAERETETMAETKEGLNEFLDELAAPTATPGGGSAAAAAAAMAAALGAMVSGLAKLPADAFEADRKFFAEAVKRDAASYDAVRAAYKRPKDERAPFVEQALHKAAEVPLEVAEAATLLKGRLRGLAAIASAKFGSDIETAQGLAQAGIDGALANVRINIASMKDESLIAPLRERLGKLS